MRRSLAFALTLLSAISPALAEPDAFAQKVFGRPIGPGVNYACFARVYDAAHLGKHPRQNVTDIALLARLDGKTPYYYGLSLGLHLRKSRELHTAFADCSATGAAAGAHSLRCSASCEGGSVDIVIKDDGSVWLTFPNNGSIWIPQAEGGPVKPSGLGGDDALFRLDRASGAACTALTDDKDEAAALKAQK